jgi:hypothetical protein
MDQMEGGADDQESRIDQRARPDVPDAILPAAALATPAPPPQLVGMYRSTTPRGCDPECHDHVTIGVVSDGGTTPAVAASTALAPTPPRQLAAAKDTPFAAPWPPAPLQHLLLRTAKRGKVDGMAITFLDHAFIERYVPRSLTPIDAFAREQALQDRRERLRAFREKKRGCRDCTRKIRYASRKALAEVRPRIQPLCA